MFTIRFLTRTYRPDALITLRNSVDGWDDDQPGEYRDDQWRFELDEGRYPAGMEYKLVLDRSRWMMGPNRRVVPTPDSEEMLDESTVQFPTSDGLVVENGTIPRRFFAPNLDSDHLYDSIVVGSGVGGGTIADQLADFGADVLVLEAGSYLFPTHVANLPREHLVGRFDKHVWSLWRHFAVANYEPVAGYVGAQGFNFGGRSIFWGGLAPRMANWELEPWPAEVATDLLPLGYRAAEEALKVRTLLPSKLQEETHAALDAALPDWSHMDAPVAVQYSGFTGGAIPSGMFSTADLLMESRLAVDAPGQRLQINLNHLVTRLEFDGGRVAAVVCQDLIASEERRYRGRNVILAAGTLETVRIAKQSGLGHAAIGRGLTDHPIFFTHFAIHPGQPLYRTDDSSKTLSRHKRASSAEHPFSVVLELGADFNQGRYIDDDLLAQHRREKGDFMLCEVVFLVNAPLVEDNGVEVPGPFPTPLRLSLAPSPAADAYHAEIEALKDQIIVLLGGEAIADDDLQLHRSEMGAVAHEVGTMRMGTGPDAVVDTDLRVVGIDNLYVCDLSVFPSSPAANPTLTLVALGLRLAALLAR